MHGSKLTEAILLGASLGMFLATLAGIPLFLVRIPDDYFVRRRKHSRAVSVLRTIVGILLVALGIAMLVLPGQGLLTVLVGLTLMDLPFKKRLIRKLLSNEKISRSLTKLRRKHGRGPLKLPEIEDRVPRHA